MGRGREPQPGGIKEFEVKLEVCIRYVPVPREAVSCSVYLFNLNKNARR